MRLVKSGLEITRKPLKFSYRELLELDRASILGDKRVVLIAEELIERSPPNPRHAMATTELSDMKSGSSIGLCRCLRPHGVRKFGWL